ncbi:MAG: RNA-binding protein [Phycisphaeraceae bacterium]|nr:RNA-binding protein [Phycisphaeraceae bacterium]
MKIYVGNLSFDTSESTLRNAFSEHGEVAEVSIVTDRDTGRPRGFAFVTMPQDAAARAAIGKLNGTPLDGRTLTVNEAQAKTASPRGGFGGGGGGGGRGGDRGGDRKRGGW